MPQSSYSRHAWSRVLERLSLAPAEVAALLDYDLAVSVGVRGRRVHRLFFSPPDQQCFVAIQDRDVGVIVTILPLDYHASSAWTISRDAQDHAEHLIRNRPTFSTEEITSQDSSEPSVFRVGCYVTNGQGGLRFQNLGSLNAFPFEHNVALLLEDDAALDDIQRRIHTRCRLGEVLVEVFVRLGRNGSVTRIDLDQRLGIGSSPDRRDNAEGRPPSPARNSRACQVSVESE